MSTIVLSRPLMAKAVTDPAFMAACPEFLTLTPKLTTMSIKQDANCKGCQQTRVEQNITNDFLSIVHSLNLTGKQALKAYFHAEKLLYNMYSPATGEYITIVI